jgi:hypothetical protein
LYNPCTTIVEDWELSSGMTVEQLNWHISIVTVEITREPLLTHKCIMDVTYNLGITNCEKQFKVVC